ncbi:MAG: DEAD/DEAH box helicase family protein, partial [Blastocatellia bacterium]|nr:DEAD/DEAH box helicase family protein [Blastocatellia bacterium]
VIECGRPAEPAAIDSLNLAIFRQLRNQKNEYIPQLFLYSQLLLAVNNQRARYGTVGTRKEFWSCWREEDTEKATRAVGLIINKPLSREQKDKLFGGRFAYLREYFDDLELEERPANEQDLMIYCLCRPERMLELARQFVVFEAGEKKIARYYQYFAVKKSLARIKRMGTEGRKTGGVIWHTQGSGKSLALIMMAKAIALDSAILDPRIVLVTDRIDLAEQIWGTFRSCGREPVQARTGRHLLELLSGRKATIIPALTDKFETAVRSQGQQNPANNIFFLVDESHRGRYDETILKMQKLLPNACYIGFTGTPLKNADKEVALRLGGIIDSYPSSRAIRDEVIVPLLYERRKLVGISEIAGDISDHFCKNWQGTPFKAQLIADSKLSALKFKQHLDGFGKISSEVLISSPDVGEEGEAEIQSFWARIMERYGSEKEYNRSVINAFKNGERPEIIIVVDKLLAEFNVPRNTVLYLARGLDDHPLLRAIARVNRPYPGKDFGYVIDYCDVAGEAGVASGASGALAQFDEADLQELLQDISEEAAKLPVRRAELWGLFKEDERDVEKFERSLADKERREEFAARLLAFSRTMSVAFSSAKFTADTAQETLEIYRQDLSYFHRLRLNVNRRYAVSIDFGEYSARVEKLVNTYAAEAENPQTGQLVDIFERERFRAEVDQLPSEAAKADTIAYRTKKTISEKMEEDPTFYRRLSKSIDELIRSWRDERISDAEYLNKAV